MIIGDLTMKDKIINANGIQKTFANNGEQVHVLSGLDIDIYKGDFTVIMGSSGSGKSTLLYALSGMDRATAGNIMYTDKSGRSIDVASSPEKILTTLRVADFGFVFQQMHLISNLTLFENVAVTGYLNKSVTAAETRERAAELLERMDLADVMDHLPSRVSGGQQQRCAIARAVINKPELLFADEPTGALNKKNTTEVLDLLTEINRDGQSIVMVTHDQRAALRGDRLLYLEDGQIIGDLSLPKYGEKDSKGETIQTDRARESQVTSWLSSLNW